MFFKNDLSMQYICMAMGKIMAYKLWLKGSLLILDMVLRDKFIRKLKFSHYVLTPMPRESQVRLCSPFNMSQQNCEAAFSWTMEVAADLF